ncbi:ChaN family lipoprotein [Bdellovibrio sp. HCB2-146]|uniref:ChaN family lipoprotein n=1 Tax=Bdellovibrio sp. HCB2-146 TaxID=3394362 RepID=UPI0039BCC0AA
MERQVRARLGEDTPELLRYRKLYEKEFNKKWQPVAHDELWDQVAQSRVLLMGDFHALHQSQKAQVRVLRNIPKERRKILAVEFFEAADQEKIDRYLSGKMSEKDFLKGIQWQSRWGFPWEHYRPLLRWAQKNKIPVVGLNRSYKKRTGTTLKSRDVFAGKKIAELVKQHHDALICVIYGDLHLAKEHIPAEIEKNLGPAFSKHILRLFQNSEKIYFQLLKQEKEAHADLIRISRNIFCLMSVPPWVKWQNYLMYLEQAYDLGLAKGLIDEDDEDEEFLDYSDHVGRYVKIISDELGHPVSLSGLSVYSTKDKSFWSQLKSVYDLRKLKWIEYLIAEEMSFYLPEAQIAYLARPTVNHAASLAMQYVHAQMSPQLKLASDMPNDFERLIWLEGISYFGSKIINHKRKTDTIADIKSSLSSKGPIDLGKEALQLALAQKMHELMAVTGSSRRKLQAKPKRKLSFVVAARLLGGILGERLYFGYHKKILSRQTVVGFLKKPVSSESFSVAYYEMLEVIEALPVPFHSKKEKL